MFKHFKYFTNSDQWVRIDKMCKFEEEKMEYMSKAPNHAVTV
jgi:hypothetical protein